MEKIETDVTQTWGSKCNLGDFGLAVMGGGRRREEESAESRGGEEWTDPDSNGGGSVWLGEDVTGEQRR